MRPYSEKGGVYTIFIPELLRENSPRKKSLDILCRSRPCNGYTKLKESKFQLFSRKFNEKEVYSV